MGTPREPRAFVRDADLGPMLDLVGGLRAGPQGSHFLHPGGLQWLLRRLRNEDFAIWIWGAAGKVVGFVVEDGDYAMPHADPRRIDLADLLTWAEDHARTRGRRSIEISVWDDDLQLRQTIAERGYMPATTFGPELMYAIQGEPPPATLTEGYYFTAFTPEMDDAYVELHRDAWSTIRPSPYRRELHDIVMSMPFFDRDLVPLVSAADGTLAAYCIGWYDPATRTTEIEPLGTRPQFRGKGLAHAVVREVIHRSWARGALSVVVWGTNANEPAKRLYTSSGMRPQRVIREYRRDL